MAVPKGRVSKAKRDSRRASNFKIATPSLVRCGKCKELVRAHTMCKSCGTYDGREIKKTAE